MPNGGLGLVLSGGGARGMFQVGVYEALLRLPGFVRPRVLSGTSAGAINAAFIAAGKTPEDMKSFWLSLANDTNAHSGGFFERLRAIVLGRGGPTPAIEANPKLFNGLYKHGGMLLGYESQALLSELGMRGVARSLARSWRPWNGRALADFVTHLMTTGFGGVKGLLEAVQGTHVFNTNRLRERLREFLHDPVCPKPDGALAVSAVDVHRGEVVRYIALGKDVRKTTLESPYVKGKGYQHFEHGIPHDVILASAAIPLLLEPQWINDPVGGTRRLLWDGGLLVNTPLAPAVDLLADEVLPVLATYGPQNEPRMGMSLGDTVERLADCFLENTYNVDRKLFLTRNIVAEDTHDTPKEKTHVCRRATLYEPIRPRSPSGQNDVQGARPTFSAGSYLDFHRDALLAMHAEGAPAVEAWRGAFESTNTGYFGPVDRLRPDES